MTKNNKEQQARFWRAEIARFQSLDLVRGLRDDLDLELCESAGKDAVTENAMIQRCVERIRDVANYFREDY